MPTTEKRGPLRVGFADADITPSGERQTLYHRLGEPTDERTPIRDRLWVRAIAFRSGNDLAVWVTADVLCIDTPLRAKVMASLAARGIPDECIVLCATHTHTAPSVVHFHGRPPTPATVLDSLADQLAQVALAALEQAEPATLRVGRTTVDLNVNRREIGRMNVINDIAASTGAVDDEVLVVLAESARGVSCLFNYAAHPLTMSKNVPQISADFPGRSVRQLQNAGNRRFAQFLQGCCGDLNVKIHGHEAEADRAGKIMAEAVLRASAGSRESRSDVVRTALKHVQLPWRGIPSRDEAHAILERQRGAGDASTYAGKRHLDWAEELWRVVCSGEVQPYAEVLVQATRVGDAILIALPGEIFSEIGLAIKARVDCEHVFVCAYANNCEVGYVPTAAAFDEGGYEVDAAPYYYGLFQLSPDCAQVLTDAAVEVAAQV